MNNITQIQSNIFLKIKNYIKENLKIILFLPVFIFFIFLSFQLFSYYKINQIEKNSVVFFEAKEIDNQNRMYELMDELSNNKDFYSILSSLEIVRFNLENNNFNLAKEIYFEILNNKKLENIYMSAISANAAYNFIDIQYKNTNLNFLKDIENFISYIDDNLESYQGTKLELKYLLAITELNLNNLSYKDFIKTSNLYSNIMESENISSAIRERVNKIHEFLLFN